MRDVLLRGGQARTLTMLGVVTVLLVALAIFAVSLQRRALTSDFETRLMFPELAEQVNEAGRVEVVSRLSKVTVVRDADSEQWRLNEKEMHPARAELVKQTVVGLSDLELVEERTALADWHKHINLTDPADKGTGVRVAVYDVAGEELASLIVGKLEGSADIDGTGTIYVRHTDEDQAYVARGSFNLEQQPVAWLDTGVIDLAPGRVVEVDVQPQAGEAYAVALVESDGADAPAYEIVDLAETLQPTTDYAVTGIGNGLVDLVFTDVEPRADVTLEAPVTSVYRTSDGLEVTVQAEKLGRSYYAMLDAKALDGADDAVVSEAEALSDRLSPYAFALSTPRGADLTRMLDALVEAKATDGAEVNLEAVEGAN
ncbi:MAG: DUF4340 domain-containing protein [Candidatus Phaeomarinobacter sp.]